MPLRVVVIGGGGREHALVKKLRQSPLCGELVAIPGNGGMAAEAECLPLDIKDIAKVVAWCADNLVDYVVVAPDDPLAAGMVDALEAKGIPAFGPTRAAARIESSKAFAKGLMRDNGIPTAEWQSFGEVGEAMAYIRARGCCPVVVKADGLALGKGVVICESEAEAEAALRAMLTERRFGEAGASVVVEEFLTGPELSVLALCDGERLLPLASSMDHKRAYDGDKGPNTGGMGAVAPSPFYTEAMARRCMEEIFMPTVQALRRAGAPFKGCLYFGLMLCPQGPKVIEYNCRFGDPETQVVLPLMEGDLLAAMLACTEGRLRPDMLRVASGAAACVVLASGGYPGAYGSGLAISGLEEAAALPGVQIYHAGTRLDDGQTLTAGGRVLGVTAMVEGLEQALAAAYGAVDKITFNNMHYRKDIGRTAQKQ